MGACVLCGFGTHFAETERGKDTEVERETERQRDHAYYEPTNTVQCVSN